MKIEVCSRGILKPNESGYTLYLVNNTSDKWYNKKTKIAQSRKWLALLMRDKIGIGGFLLGCREEQKETLAATNQELTLRIIWLA